VNHTFDTVILINSLSLKKFKNTVVSFKAYLQRTDILMKPLERVIYPVENSSIQLSLMPAILIYYFTLVTHSTLWFKQKIYKLSICKSLGVLFSPNTIKSPWRLNGEEPVNMYSKYLIV